MKTAMLMLGLALGANQASAVTDGQLVYGETTRLDTFDPYTVHEGSGQRLSDLLFDSLVEVGPGGAYVPSLAKSWTIEASGWWSFTTTVRLGFGDTVSLGC